MACYTPPQPRTAAVNAPLRPGVYFFYSADRQILYIGKAINLRNRLKQHFPAEEKLRSRPSRQHVAAASTAWVSWIVTESELHALVMEDELIKNHLPIVNKRQKKFLLQEYVGVVSSSPPRFVSFGASSPVPGEVEEHFGPFSDRFFVQDLLRMGNRYFGISCGQSEAIQGMTDYSNQAGDFRSFLAGKDTRAMDRLEALMKSYASSRQFELAAKARDALEFCEIFMRRQSFHLQFRNSCLAIQGRDSRQTWLFIKGRLSLHTPAIMKHGAIKLHFLSESLKPYECEADWRILDRAQVVQSWLYKNRGTCTHWFEPCRRS